MECVSRDQLGPASSVPALSLLVLLVLVCVCVCVLHVCGGREMVTPANNSDEMAEVVLQHLLFLFRL